MYRLLRFAANDRFKNLVISTIGEISQFEEISPRTLVEMTALIRLSVIHSLFPFKKWVNSRNDGFTDWGLGVGGGFAAANSSFIYYHRHWQDEERGRSNLLLDF